MYFEQINDDDEKEEEKFNLTQHYVITDTGIVRSGRVRVG